MAARLEIHQLAARPGDPGGAFNVGKHDDAVGVADVELVLHKGHAERLAEAREERLALICHAVTIRIAQQRDAVCTDPAARARFMVAVMAWSNRCRMTLRGSPDDSATSTSPFGST